MLGPKYDSYFCRQRTMAMVPRLVARIFILLACQGISFAWTTASTSAVSTTSSCFLIPAPALPATSRAHNFSGRRRLLLRSRGASVVRNASKRDQLCSSGDSLPTRDASKHVHHARTVTCDELAAPPKGNQQHVHDHQPSHRYEKRHLNSHEQDLVTYTGGLSLQIRAATAAAGLVLVAWASSPPDALAAFGATVDVAQAATVDLGAVFAKAGKASLGGGVSGAAAAVVQVLSLMWLRTTMNFQVKFKQ